MRNLLMLSLVVPILATLSFNAAYAELSEKHVQVALRSIKFITPKIGSGASVAVVYADGDAASKATAESIAAFINSGKAVRKIKLNAKAVSSSGDLSGTRITLFTDGAMAQVDSVSAAAKSNNSIGVASDTACTQSGKCVLSIQTKPKVQIFLNAAAAGETGVSFSNAFMMLVKKH
ncbi:hypothetical protein QGN29_01090 [Temperatibacter marinus]|uniref:YfiR family protein n=1 Tax=Temperatibacter marinus TaxID=1456591 RepID=A0AA52EGY5_9PROT|nr:hypothetical protein [Temperatibacter marinus]WND02958.1 hypothetical protein QGN29_01090 [Temperatibacter marinus]